MIRGQQLRDVGTPGQQTSPHPLWSGRPPAANCPHTESETGRRDEGVGPPHSILSFLREEDLSRDHPADLFLNPFHHGWVTCPFLGLSREIGIEQEDLE